MKLLAKNYFLTLFFGLSLTFILSIVIINSQVAEEEYKITVEPGDSLWALADKFKTEKSRDAWINEVMKINNLYTAHIKAGDVLIIPSEKEQFNFENSTELAGDSQ
ncbi:LysM peptidoglycan-binding domain-containing protein [Psychrobacillus sp. FJAT-51614]|uniref:LysM peptidoglycan-binding domain-containing protein n=1 Tax=Psychrobacillus mangrovi TaxID=3117745 RepID=A0ABU8F0D5_9BACI